MSKAVGDGSSSDSVQPPSASAADVSRYVADICGELAKMTKSAKLMMLSYLLAMARQEAERIAHDASSRETQPSIPSQ